MKHANSLVSAVSYLRFKTIRVLERMCQPQTLYRLLAPVASLRAAFKKCPSALPLPAVIGTGSVIPGTDRFWRNFYLNCTLTNFPERLAAPEWINRCSFSGLDELLEVHRRGQPAVVVVFHFGPVFLLRFWLRAAGIRAATLVSGEASDRSYMHRLRDRARLFPEIPTVFHRLQFRNICEFLATGNVLVIAVDCDAPSYVKVPVDAHYSFRMAAGAIRLAAEQGARLFPCNIIDEGQWRFRIELGRPVPKDLLCGMPDFASAGKHLLDEMLPCLRAHPEQCTQLTFDSFRVVARSALARAGREWANNDELATVRHV
ncbi:MAG TPA: hypothetical protein VN836_04395 [Verrucomicrobiae bacterium]|nr:hypothetical protein [Verrucomicrobiae bacterium]